jgi:hypothetical protein
VRPPRSAKTGASRFLSQTTMPASSVSSSPPPSFVMTPAPPSSTGASTPLLVDSDPVRNMNLLSPSSQKLAWKRPTCLTNDNAN